MLLESKTEPFDDSKWFFEYKWDGFRALIFINEEELTIISRNQKILTAFFPELNSLKKFFKYPVILDGELIAYNGQKGCFSKLLTRAKRYSANVPIKFVIFDILVFKSKEVISEPLHLRKEMLPQINEECFFTSPYSEGKGREVYKLAAKSNFEGIVAKNKDSLYYPGKRSHEWLKIKNFSIGEYVVVGFRLIGSCPQNLIITDKEKSFVQEIALPGSEVKKQEWLSLISNIIDKSLGDMVTVKPFLGAKISYLEKTNSNKLRHAKLLDFFPLKG